MGYRNVDAARLLWLDVVGASRAAEVLTVMAHHVHDHDRDPVFERDRDTFAALVYGHREVTAGDVARHVIARRREALKKQVRLLIEYGCIEVVRHGGGRFGARPWAYRLHIRADDPVVKARAKAVRVDLTSRLFRLPPDARGSNPAAWESPFIVSPGAVDNSSTGGTQFPLLTVQQGELR